MRMLRNHRIGGRLHVVVCIRDIVMSSVARTEHAPRYHNEPHIRVLNWDRESLLYLLQRKLERLPAALLMRRPPDGPPSISDWLGLNGDWPGIDGTQSIEDYLLGHTRMIPRDIVSLGNELSEEVVRHKQAGQDTVSAEAVRTVVARCAKRFGDSQLAQCANQVSSDQMPGNAARYDYSETYTSSQEYIQDVHDQLRDLVGTVRFDRFTRSELDVLQDLASQEYGIATDLASVLWQNGLLGYVDYLGRRRFYSLGDVGAFNLPPDVKTYVLHPCLVYAVGGIQQIEHDRGPGEWT
jgi:hypothetical protein